MVIATCEEHHEMFISGQSTKLEVVIIFSEEVDDGINLILTLTLKLTGGLTSKHYRN